MRGARRLPAEDRRRDIVEHAFAMVAEAGFEGLRTRDVAERAQINSATLHHYFPSKEDLIAGIAERLAEAFTADKAPPSQADPLHRLRQQFADLQRYVDRRPELLSVYRELVVRTQRDSATRRIVEQLNAGWCADVRAILENGVRAGVFRPDLVPEAAARSVVGALWGMATLLQLQGQELTAACATIEEGMLASMPPSSR